MRMVDGGVEESLSGAELLLIVHPISTSETGLNSVLVVICSRLVVVPTLTATTTSRSGGLVGAPTASLGGWWRPQH